MKLSLNLNGTVSFHGVHTAAFQAGYRPADSTSLPSRRGLVGVNLVPVPFKLCLVLRNDKILRF